jgi:membrane carboxypeptidase/penicillin-binding protein PbpC
VAALQEATLPLFLDLMQRFGVTTLTRPDYGLSLSLGAGEIPLIELTDAFAALANGGQRIPPVTIQKITDAQGEVICEQGTAEPCQPGVEAATQVVSPVDAFLLTDILSDNAARTPMSLAPALILRLDRPAAVKTGTTNDFRDNLTVGYTPQLVTGVWVGNADNSPMINISGVAGAGPIWNQFMTAAHTRRGRGAISCRRPACASSRSAPTPARCPATPARRSASTGSPRIARRSPRSRICGGASAWCAGRIQLATEFTPADQVEERDFKVYPLEHREWAIRNGIAQPPIEAVVAPPTPAPGELQIAITSPSEGRDCARRPADLWQRGDSWHCQLRAAIRRQPRSRRVQPTDQRAIWRAGDRRAVGNVGHHRPGQRPAHTALVVARQQRRPIRDTRAPLC